MTLRKIIHIDMDAVYASVEQRDDPTLRASLWLLPGAGNYVSYVGVPHGVVLKADELFWTHVHLYGGPRR